MDKLRFHESLKKLRRRIAASDLDDVKIMEDMKKMEVETDKITIKRQFDISGLPRKLWFSTLDDVVPKTPLQKSLVAILKRCLDRYVATGEFVRLPYIYGPPGTGKSFLSMTFISHLITNKIYDVSFCSISRFLIKARDFNNKENIDDLTRPRVLLLDDLCSHNSTKFVAELLHAVLDYRLNDEKPTIITSNVPINNIGNFLYTSGKSNGVSKRIGSAIEDRIFELCSISILKGESLRLVGAVKRYKASKSL